MFHCEGPHISLWDLHSEMTILPFIVKHKTCFQRKNPLFNKINLSSQAWMGWNGLFTFYLHNIMSKIPLKVKFL